MDQFQRWSRKGKPCYLRIKNFQDNPVVEELGFTYSPDPTGPTIPEGTTDILVDPPPSITLLSFAKVAFAQQAGSSLLAGARLIIVSHTWVLNQMQQPWFLQMCAAQNPPLDPTEPRYVFRGPQIVGFVTDNLLLEIKDLEHDDAFGQEMNWLMHCNTHELSTSQPGS